MKKIGSISQLSAATEEVSSASEEDIWLVEYNDENK